MLLNTIPGVCLQYDAQLDLLRVHWHGGVGMSHFRASSLQLVALAKCLGVRRCLLDMDSLPDISAYDQVWMGLHWLPKVLQLPLQQVVFTIQPRRVYHQLAIDSLLALARPFIRFEVHFFDEPLPALRWLTEETLRLPVLLAEWESRPAGPVPASASLPAMVAAPVRRRWLSI